MNRRQRGVVHRREGQDAGRRNLQKSQRDLGEDRRRNRGDRGKNGVGVADRVVAAQAAVSLGWILHRLKIVGYRDHREQNQDEHGEGDQLSPPAGSSLSGVPQPDAEKHRG